MLLLMQNHRWVNVITALVLFQLKNYINKIPVGYVEGEALEILDIIYGVDDKTWLNIHLF